jgi:hypothetical protein
MAAGAGRAQPRLPAARAGASPGCSRAPPTTSCASSCPGRSSTPSSASGCR